MLAFCFGILDAKAMENLLMYGEDRRSEDICCQVIEVVFCGAGEEARTKQKLESTFY